jgi:hypothetical protein
MFSQPKTQADLVANFMRKREVHKEIEEELKWPGIKDFFVVPDKAQERKHDTLVIKELKRAPVLSRKDIATLLLGCFEMRPGLTSINWNVLNPTQVSVTYTEKSQTKPQRDPEDIVDVLNNILKSRARLVSLKWIFGDDHVMVTYSPTA